MKIEYNEILVFLQIACEEALLMMTSLKIMISDCDRRDSSCDCYCSDSEEYYPDEEYDVICDKKRLK